MWKAKLAGSLACQRGDLDTAQRWADTAAIHMPPNEEAVFLPVRASYRLLRAQIAQGRGDLHVARQELAPIWDAAGADRVPDIWRPLLLGAQIEADLVAGLSEPPDGTENPAVAAIRALADQVPQIAKLAPAWSAHLDAELARAAGRDDPSAWLGVADAWRELGHVPYLAYSLTRLGAARLSAGDRDGAAGPLTEAFDIASDLGAEPLRARIIELAHRGRLKLGDQSVSRSLPESGRIGHLTPREIEVLRLVAQGMSNSEIAEKLFITPKTASVHVSRILSKLGVNSRAKATAIAYEERVLTDTD